MDWSSFEDADLGTPFIGWGDIKNSDFFYPKGYDEYQREANERYVALKKKKRRANIKKWMKSKKKRKRYYNIN
jgi:hypothetical protein